MAGKSLSYLSDTATQQTNTTGVTTPILTISPETGTKLKLLASVATGEEEGHPLIFKPRDSNGDPLPADTELVLRVKRPTDDEPVTVSVKEDNIAPWIGLSTSDQRDEEYIDQIKIELQGNVNVRDKDDLRVELNSSKQIDWSETELYFLRQAVREMAFEG